MTKLTPGKTVRRETAAIRRGKPLVVELFAHHLRIRRKGTHEMYIITWEAVFDAAGELAARELRAAKRAS